MTVRELIEALEEFEKKHKDAVFCSSYIENGKAYGAVAKKAAFAPFPKSRVQDADETEKREYYGVLFL